MVVKQYDHEVQGGSVIKPFVGELYDGPGDAAVYRPFLDSWKGFVVSNGINPLYSSLDLTGWRQTPLMKLCEILPPWAEI